MAGAARFRVEHVAEAPRGWRTRTVVPGPQSQHEVRIAFPPGRRQKGKGRVVEILHPKDEKKNPCEITRKAKTNPGELLIFGNPEGTESRYIRRSLYHQLQEAAKEHGETIKQESGAHGGIVYVYQGKQYTPGELADKLGVRWPNGKLEKQREARDRAARIRSARLGNASLYDAIGPRDRVTIVNRFGQQRTGRAVMRGPAGWVLNMGGPHGTPAIATPENVTKVKKTNDGEDVFRKHQIAIAKATLKMSDAGARIMGGMTKEEARAILKKRQAKNNASYFGVYSTRETGKFQLDSVETTRSAANKEAARLRGQGHKAKVSGPRSDKNFPVPRRNPFEEETKAVQLFRGFHGHDPKQISEKHVSAAVRLEYTALGDLEYIKVLTPLDQEAEFNFEGDGVKLASSPDGKQLYAIGGNQNLLNTLDEASQQKDFIDLGEAQEVQYLARKIHGKFRPVSYYHQFGEARDGSTKPRLMFDKIRNQIFFIGGEYWIDTSIPAPGTPLGKISPGIEN